MDENKFKAILQESLRPILDRLGGIEERLTGVEGRLTGVEKQLNDPDTGLKRLNERVDSNTGAIIELERTIKGYADAYKVNDSNIRKLDKRLKVVERKNKISADPEFELAPVSDL